MKKNGIAVVLLAVLLASCAKEQSRVLTGVVHDGYPKTINVSGTVTGFDRVNYNHYANKLLAFGSSIPTTIHGDLKKVTDAFLQSDDGKLYLQLSGFTPSINYDALAYDVLETSVKVATGKYDKEIDAYFGY